MSESIIEDIGWKLVKEREKWDPLEELISCITPPITKGMVRFLDIAIIGKAGSGKTTTEWKLAEYVLEKYGEDKVNVFISQSLVACIEAFWEDPKPVNVIIIDDPLKNYLARGGTTSDMKKAIAQFHEIRHRLEDALTSSDSAEDRTGVVITIMGSQSYKALDKTWRNGVLQIFKTNIAEDEMDVRKCIGNSYFYRKLQEITMDVYIRHIDKARGRMVAVFAGVKSGIITLSMPDRPKQFWDSKWREEQKIDSRKKVESWNERVDKYTQIIMNESGIDITQRGVSKLVRDYLRREYPEDWEELTRKSRLRDIMDSCFAHSSKILAEIKEQSEVMQTGGAMFPSDMRDAYEPPILKDFEFFTYNEAEEILKFPGLYKTRLRNIHLYNLMNHPKESASLIEEGKMNITSSIKAKDIDQNDILQQLEIGRMTQEMIAKLTGLSQFQISSIVGKGNNSAKAKEFRGTIDYDRGHRFERYVQKRFEDGYSLCFKSSDGTDSIGIDCSEIDEVIMDGRTGQPDVVLIMKDGGKYFISLKTANESGSRTVNVGEIMPELNLFKESLGSDGIDTKDKLMILVRNLAFDDFLSYMVVQTSQEQQKWEKQVLDFADIPENFTFNQFQREKNEKPYAFWKKVVA